MITGIVDARWNRTKASCNVASKIKCRCCIRVARRDVLRVANRALRRRANAALRSPIARAQALGEAFECQFCCAETRSNTVRSRASHRKEPKST